MLFGEKRGAQVPLVAFWAVINIIICIFNIIINNSFETPPGPLPQCRYGSATRIWHPYAFVNKTVFNSFLNRVNVEFDFLEYGGKEFKSFRAANLKLLGP